jgi:hypothetical protein
MSQDVDARDKSGHDEDLGCAFYGLFGSNRFSKPFQQSA